MSTDKSSSDKEATIQQLSTDRSTQQGVVRGYITRIRTLIQENAADKQKVCENTCKRMLEQLRIHDEIHKELRQMMIQSAKDTVEIDAKCKKLSTDTAACYQDAQTWQIKKKSSPPAIAAKPTVTGAGGNTPTKGDDVGATSTDEHLTGSSVDESKLLADQHALLIEKSEELEQSRDQISDMQTALIKQEEEAQRDRDRFERMMSDLQSQVSDLRKENIDLGRDLDDEKHHSEDYRARLVRSEQESRQSYGPPRLESTRASMDTSDLMNITQAMNRSNAEVMTKMLETSTAQNKSFIMSLQTPKIEMPIFTGDMTEYHSFISRYDDLVGDASISDAAKLNTLLQYCSPDIKRHLDCCNYKTPVEGLKTAKEILRTRYGNPFLVSQAWVEKMMETPVLKKPDEILRFSSDLRSCHLSLTSLGYLSDLENTANMKVLVSRVPGFIQNRYRKKNRENIKNGTRSTLEQLINIISDAADELADPIYGPESIKKLIQSTEKAPEKKMFRNKGAAHTTASTDGDKSRAQGRGDDKRPQRKLKCSFCQGEHYPRLCPDFTSVSAKEKLDLVNSKRLCVLCLNPYHDVTNCVMKWTCQVESCKARHNTKLHDSFVGNKSEKNSNAVATVAESDVDSTDGSDESSDVGLHSAIADSYSLPVVPVHLGGKHMIHETNALIDTGATLTFITRRLFEKLCIKPYAREHFSMSTMGKSVSWIGDVANFSMKAVDTETWMNACGVAVVEELPVASTYVKRLTDLDKWPYLKSLKMPIPRTNTVEMLIGQSNARLFSQEKQVNGPSEGMPYAVRLPIGWVVMGHYVPHAKSTVHQNTVSVLTDDNLETQVDAFWRLEDVPDVPHENPVNVEIVRMWDEKSVLVDGHLQVPIPVKSDPPNLKNNYVAVKKRFDSLTRRLQRDDNLREQYVASMRAMFDKGYAEECVDPPREGYLYYHPQQAVISERRPGKCRVVGDLSITFEDDCLNKSVHQGPNYTANITDVITQFRMYRVAITGDVREMFSQVVVPEEQRDLLRFLWYKDDKVGGEIVECHMRTHPFGGIWCPAAAMYVFHWVIEHLGQDEWKEIIITILRHFYVDDLLRSVTDTDVGLRLIKGVRRVLHQVGYDLVKIGSSDRQILDSLPMDLRAKAFQDLELKGSGDTVTYTLGSVWQPVKDVLGFRAVPLDKPFTRRGILSTSSSLYDPLGLIAPFILKAKMFLQKVCKLQLEWDEPIPALYNPEWKSWLADVPLVGKFSVPRWLGLTGDETDVCQLHTFTDASQEGYGAAVYLVVETKDGVVRSSNLVMSKAKVTPMNHITIPRLELSAAVLGVKLERAVRRMLNDVPISESYFWTDSMIVLWYVRGQSWKYKTFVANRMAYLQERTKVSQWKYVPTDQNPADCVSRGFTAKELLEDRIWTRGPEFLMDKDKLHAQPDMTCQGEKNELRKRPVNAVFSMSVKVDDTGGIEHRILSHYSRWNKMVRSVCVLRRFIRYLKTKKVARSHYTVDEVKSAEHVIFTWVQQTSITPTQRKSKMFAKLFPFDDSGVLRVGGRLMMSSLNYENKHPPILPDSPATKVFIRHVHERNGHAGIDRTYYDVREHVWVLGGKTTVKGAIGRCVWCRRMRGKLATQVMAPLPSCRVNAGTVPFEKVGVDYCGPFFVKVGRSMCKRYVCTITCLLTRAVHFEIPFFLTTSSFLHALQRFIARRGRPKSILSDNGSNFIGAKRELREALKSFNSDYIGQKLADDGIEWHFNVPLASHHGGVWERINRSYRSTFQAIARHQVLTDETLPTFAAAAEQVLNSRPLTRVSEELDGLEVITPSHLLHLGKTEPIAGKYDKADALRGQWKRIQYMSDLFWKRWTRTYLQSLQLRQKWTDEGADLSVGEIVLLLDESAPRLHWPLGRVIEVYQGRDGHVRSALLKTQTGEYRRPLTKLLRLECDVD